MPSFGLSADGLMVAGIIPSFTSDVAMRTSDPKRRLQSRSHRLRFHAVQPLFRQISVDKESDDATICTCGQVWIQSLASLLWMLLQEGHLRCSTVLESGLRKIQTDCSGQPAPANPAPRPFPPPLAPKYSHNP